MLSYSIALEGADGSARPAGVLSEQTKVLRTSITAHNPTALHVTATLNLVAES